MKKLFLLLTLSLLVACGGDSDSSNPCGTDNDGDGYVTGTDCSAIDPAKIDCDDSNGNLWSSKADSSCAKNCLDEDKDGYFSQCDSYPTDSDGKELIDCDDSNQRAWTVENGKCAFPCSDNDNDGYYYKCEGEYPDNKQDCYDKNSTLWTIDPDSGECLNSCVDRDKDGYFTGCDAYPLDENNQPKIDCDDNDQLRHTPVSETDLTCKSNCIDNDKDGYYINCERFDDSHPEDHCDGDPANWDANRCRYLDHENTVLNPDSTCVDKDGDGYVLSCNRYIDGLKGPDCNDDPNNPLGVNNHEKCLTCIDEDGDGLYVGCDRYSSELQKDDDDWFNGHSGPYDVLVVIDSRISKSLTAVWETYRLAHPDKKISFKIIPPGSVEILKGILKTAYQSNGIEAALLVGNLPMAWYEKNINYGGSEGYKWEEFPTDTYLGNFSATWYDDDSDGMYDRKSSNATKLELITTRIQGEADDIAAYFDRVYRYQTEGPLVEEKAFIFIDDEFTYMTQNLTNMSSLYSKINWFTTFEETSKEVYMREIVETGGEFFFQVIHASPTELAVNENGASNQEDAVYSHITLWELDAVDPKGTFFNLFDCSASRFSQENLANTYLLQPYALNTIGASKVTITHDPSIFHRELAYGESWGEAFKTWYNNYGANDEDWFLGTMIMGDPLIVIKEDAKKMLQNVKPVVITPEMKAKAQKNAADQYKRIKDQLDTFEEYKSNNPQFFQ